MTLTACLSVIAAMGLLNAVQHQAIVMKRDLGENEGKKKAIAAIRYISCNEWLWNESLM